MLRKASNFKEEIWKLGAFYLEVRMNVNQINNLDILFKTYSYSNGEMKENIVHKNTCSYTGIDKIEISKDSPEYETICGQMRSIESFGSASLGNQLFYDANEIMYDYYDGKLTEEDVKKFFKDYLYNSVGEVEENNTYQQKQVTANLSRIYEMFTRGNVRNAVNQNQKEGQNFLKEHSLDGNNEFYYNAKWYWKSEEMQQLFQETANEIVEEYGAEKVDFEAVIENSKYTLEGGLSYNAVWNWRQWGTSYTTAQNNADILEEDFVPPKDFIYCSGNMYSSPKEMLVEDDMNVLVGKEESNSIFQYIFEQNSSHFFESLLLNKKLWNEDSTKEDYVRASEILKKFHMEHYRNNRFEFLWMGAEN